MGTMEGFLVFVFDSGTLAERRGFGLPGLGDLRWKDQGGSKEVGIRARKWRSVSSEMRHLFCMIDVPRTCNKSRFQFVHKVILSTFSLLLKQDRLCSLLQELT